ncbi:MAG TPA: hypothetical protein VFG84_00710 [Gemmatimonadaceae bacterium]|nr:hypothetical protein [Gemmatimonadaceae bacterium]
MATALLAATVGTLSGENSRSIVQSCLTTGDTAGLVAFVHGTLSFSDSAALVSNGIPYKPAVVRMETDSTVCDAIVASYNGSLSPADSTKQIQDGFVVQAGYAWVLRPFELGDYPAVYFFFDSTFTYRFSLTGLD